VTLSPNGNFGIGTSSPSQQLHVNSASGNAATLVQGPAGSFAQYQLKSGATNSWTVGTQDNFKNNGLLFRNGSTDLMTIDPAGPVTQLPTANGLVKAMLLVNADGSINLCYNSQLTGNAATTVPCGFSIGFTDPSNPNPGGGYEITFPFQINTRFFSATVAQDFGNSLANANEIQLRPRSPQVLSVFTTRDYFHFQATGFYLIVF